MPKINDYSAPQTQANYATLDASTNLRNAGGMGRAVQRFGGAVDEFGDMVYRRQAQTEVSDLNAKLSGLASDFEQRIEAESRDGTIDHAKIQEDYQKAQERLYEGIGTNEGRSFLERQSTQLAGSITKSAMRGEAMAKSNKALEDMETSINRHGTDLQRKPELFSERMDLMVNGIEAQVETGILTPPQAEKIRRHVGEELGKNALRGIISKSPGAAIAEIDSGKFDDYLNPNTRYSLRESAVNEVRQRQAQGEKLLEMKDKDPWQFLQKSGEARGLKPVSFGEDVGTSVKNRFEFVDAMKKKHGIINLPLLTDQESDRFTASILNANPKDAMSLFNHIDNAVEDRFKGPLAMQVFEKEPGLAGALMIAGDSPQEAKTVIGGMSLMRNGDGKGQPLKLPEPGDVQKQFDAHFGNTIADPVSRKAAREAIAAHMTKVRFDRGDKNIDILNRDAFEESAAKVMGPVFSYEGEKVLSFRGKDGKFVDEDRFDALVSSLSEGRLSQIQGDIPRTMSGESINLEKSKGRLLFKPAGDGKYHVFVDSLMNPAWDSKGNAYKLDLKKYEKEFGKDIKERRAWEFWR